MAELKVRNLVKKFGDFTAVTDVELDVEDGEFVFLLGPSGCGKTTTLRMISGLEMPSGGHIEIGGRNVTYLRPRNRNVGMVFQDYGLYRHMTVFGNIAYPLKVRKMSRKDISEKVGAVAETMQITDVLNRKPDRLSAGQLQRVAIARMLVRDADIFLMDEPMSHLDAQLRGQMRAELRHIQKQVGVTTIFVTHDQLEAMTMADRILVMKDGQMLQFATSQEIFERPANEFVATFVGEPQMNVFDCQIICTESGPAADIGSAAIPLDADWLSRSGIEKAGSRKLRLGIRPEHISVTDPAGSTNGVPATLDSFEATGPENIYVVKSGDNEITVRASTSGTRHLNKEYGSALALQFNRNWIYLFDPQDGRTVAMAAGRHAARHGEAA